MADIKVNDLKRANRDRGIDGNTPVVDVEGGKKNMDLPLPHKPEVPHKKKIQGRMSLLPRTHYKLLNAKPRRREAAKGAD